MVKVGYDLYFEHVELPSSLSINCSPGVHSATLHARELIRRSPKARAAENWDPRTIRHWISYHSKDKPTRGCFLYSELHRLTQNLRAPATHLPLSWSSRTWSTATVTVPQVSAADHEPLPTVDTKPFSAIPGPKPLPVLRTCASSRKITSHYTSIWNIAVTNMVKYSNWKHLVCLHNIWAVSYSMLFKEINEHCCCYYQLPMHLHGSVLYAWY